MSSSVRTNFIYKSILTVSTYIIGLITFPYITRVLGVEKLGLVNFVDNTVNYFLLFATMGISILGVRETASGRADQQKLNSVFSGILGMNMLFTIGVLAVYVASILAVPQFRQYSQLFWAGAAKIAFTTFLIEWFYTGIENFKYITIRSIIIKTVYVASVFIFIKGPGDYILYFVLTVASVVLNAAVNLIYARRYVSFRARDIFPLRFLKENLTLGAYLILNSMYSTFNVIFLGFVSDNVQVGYYTTAFKLYSIVLAFFTAFTNVMLPRMNALLSMNDRKGFRSMADNSFSILYTFSIPLIIFSMIFAPQIVRIIAGEGYGEAVLPMTVIMPAALMVGIAQILAVQILTPLKKDNVLLLASVVGAVAGISLNLVLVPCLHSIGTAVVLLCSETAVTCVYIVYVLRHGITPLHAGIIGRSLLTVLPAAAIWAAAAIFIDHPLLSIASGAAVGAPVWYIINSRTRGSALKLLIKKRND